MKFCRKCDRLIKKKIIFGKIEFKCICGNIEEVNDKDVLINSESLTYTENPEMYYDLIHFAPFDRTNELVLKDCNQCGRNYLTQVRIGSTEAVIYRCKCGFTSS